MANTDKEDWLYTLHTVQAAAKAWARCLDESLMHWQAIKGHLKVNMVRRFVGQSLARSSAGIISGSVLMGTEVPRMENQ